MTKLRNYLQPAGQEVILAIRRINIDWQDQDMNTSSGLNSAPASGMRDILPQETALRDWAINRLINKYEQYGFTHIETPAMENISQLKQVEGGENLNLIFEILKRGDKLEKAIREEIDKDGIVDPKRLTAQLSDLGLRFDLTVPLVRFFAHNQAKLPYPFKSIQIGSVWRAESAQAGRYRQFTQCDIDTFGIKSEIAEMELIQATAEALLDLNFDQFVVRINDRRILAALGLHCGFSPAQLDNLFISIDKLDKIGLDGVKKELLDGGHASTAVEQIITLLNKAGKANDDLPAILSPICEEPVILALNNVMKSIRAVAAGRYSISFDLSLVRGMGYYTGQIFEIVCLGQAHYVAGGGSYDKMVGKYSGRDVPACGFSIGFERIISILMEKGIERPAQASKVALIFDQDRDPLEAVFLSANSLRQQGKHVSLLPRKKDMRKQIDSLIAEGFAGYAVYYPDKEKLEIKSFSTG